MAAGPILVAVLAIGVACWLLRYDVISSPAGPIPAVYVLDRWSGDLGFCHGNACANAINRPDPDVFTPELQN